MERKRIAYLDNLRVVATFAVIMIHVAAQNWYSQDVNTTAWKVFNFYDSVARWSVPAFVMFSGALMLGKNISLKKLYTEKIPRFLIVFLIWSLAYALIKGGSLETVLSNVIKGKTQLWFLYLIVGLYVCIPIFNKIVEDQRITAYFLMVSFALSFVLPFILQVLRDFGGEQVQPWAKALTEAYKDMNITLTGGYASCYVAGYYLSKTEIRKPIRLFIYVLGILGAALTVLLSLHISQKQGVPVGDYYGDLNLNVVVQSVAVFVWFRYNAPSARWVNEIARKLNDCSFGVYLIHFMVIDALEKQLGLNTLSFNPVLAVPVISAVVFTVSLVIAAVIRKIPILKKIII